MNRLKAILLSSTVVLGACAGGPDGGGPTVIDGPPPPVVQRVEVPVVVDPTPYPDPVAARPEKPGDPLKHLQQVNRQSIRVPDPRHYIGATYEVPTIPHQVYQVYMEEGKPTIFQFQTAGRVGPASMSKPHLWEVKELGTMVGDDGPVGMISIRPFERGLRKQDLSVKVGAYLYLFRVNTYPQGSDIYHRAVKVLPPEKGLSTGNGPAPPGLIPAGGPPGIPPEAGRDYSYSIDRVNVPWRPSAVFTHGGKTFIELPRDAGPVGRPQVVDTSTGEDRPLNWYVHDRYIVIPDTVLSKAEMRRGGQAVQIERVRE